MTVYAFLWHTVKESKVVWGSSDVLTILCSWWVMPTAGNSENASAIEQAGIDKNLI